MEYYFAVLTFTVVGTITPGPNNIMLLASGVNHGIRKSLPHYFGICIGFPILVTAVGLGLGSVFARYPYVHKAISLIGMTYLLYLAWKIANAGNPDANEQTKAPLTFFQAAAFQWVNPKAWFIAIGSVAAFTVPGRVAESVAFIIVAYVFSGFLSMGLWLKLGASLHVLLRSERRVRGFNITMAALLVLAVVPMLLSASAPHPP